MKYMAWIPNVSGNLSFSNIKGTRIPNRAKAPKTINHTASEEKGCIYSLQNRNLSDAAIPSKNGDFIYLLGAQVKNRWAADEALEGDIVTFPDSQLDDSDKNLIKTFLSSDFNDADALRLIKKLSDSSVALNFRFLLYRDGFISITLDEKHKSLSDVLKNIVVFEAYSFLKDLIHAHKFHRHDDDAIVVPYPNEDASDLKWVVKTLRNIHKSVVFSYRNASHHQDIINALGKLSYLDSFQKVAKKRYGEFLRDDCWVETDSLRSSLELKLQDQNAKENNYNNSLQTSLTVILSLFALMIAMAQLLQVPCIKGLTYSDGCSADSFIIDSGSIETVRFLLNHWSHLAMAMPSVIGLLLVWLNWWRIKRWLNNMIGHGALGAIIRVFLAFAVSERFGKLIVYAWLLILLIVFSVLLLAAGGLWEFHVS